MKKTAIAMISGVLAGLWALGAQAAPITVAYTGFSNGSQNGNIVLEGQRSTGVSAGQFGFNVVSGAGVYGGIQMDSTFDAFCIDVTTNLITSSLPPPVYDLTAASASSRLNAGQRSMIASLYDQHAASIATSGAHSAAFQLALWEILYDPGLTLSNTPASNDFYATNFSSAIGIAQGWLATINTAGNYVSSAYEFFVLEPAPGRANQALLMARQVPEPGTLALMGVGLLAIGLVRRRRSSMQ